MKKWRKITSRLVFDHQWYKLRQDEVELPNGQILDDYFVSVRPNVVLVFPVLEDGKTTLLVEQYKHGAAQILLEFPGGFCDAGETPLVSVKRELLEETGYATDQLIPMGKMHSDPTKNNNTIHLYLALNATQQQAQKLDPTEDIIIHKVAIEDLKKMILQGEIRVASTVSLAFMGMNYLGK
ncbi:MAG: NUDIX hydrolase [Saprospiraceae bacterium]|nr:NUDIX hydrolase [Saprospiraceae bacterium]